jgi:xanthine/uracil/vitamin C permease (AzgA family)
MGRSRLLGQYVVLKVFAGRFREINAAVAVIAAAFLLKLIFA